MLCVIIPTILWFIGTYTKAGMFMYHGLFPKQILKLTHEEDVAHVLLMVFDEIRILNAPHVLTTHLFAWTIVFVNIIATD